jgi:TP901 family phage tail tape measure protein
VTVGELIVRIGADLTQFNGRLTEGERALNAAAGRMSRVGTAFTTGVTLPLVAGAAAATKFAVDFNTGLANVASLMPGSTARVQELGDAVLEMSVVTGQSSADLVDGLYQVVSAFGDTADTAGILETNARAAAAGLATTTDSINLTSAVTKAYGDTSADAVTQVADLALLTVRLGQTTFPELAASIGRVTPLAAALNVTQEELFGTMATFTGVTGGAAEVSTQLRGVLQALAAPTADAANLIKELGFESGAALIEQEGLQGAIEALVSGAEASGQPLQRYISSIEAQTLALAATSGQSDAYTAKLAEMQNAAGTTDEAFKEQTEGVNAAGFAFQQLKAQLSANLVQLGNELLPTVVLVAGAAVAFAGVVSTLIGVFADLPAPVQGGVIAVVAMVAAVGPLLLVGAQLITTWVTLTAAFPLLAGGFAALAAPIGLTVVAIAGAVAAGVLIYQNWETIRGVLGTVLGPFASVAGAVLDVTVALGRLGIALFLGPAIQGVVDGFGIMKTAVVATVGLMMDGITAHFERMQAVADWVAGKLDAVTGFFDRMYETVVGGSIVPDMMDGIEDEFSRLDTDMAGAAERASAKVNEAFRNIINPSALRSMDFSVTMDAEVLYAAVIAGGENAALALDAVTSVGREMQAQVGLLNADTWPGAIAAATALRLAHEEAGRQAAILEQQQHVLAVVSGAAAIPTRELGEEMGRSRVPLVEFATQLTPATYLVTNLGEQASLTSQLFDGAGNVVRTVGSSLGSALSTLGGGVLDLFQKFTPASFVMDVFAEALKALQPAIDAITPIVTILGRAFAAGLMPILKALFPVFKLMAIAATFVGEIFFRVAQGITLAIGWAVYGIGRAIDSLPFVSARGIIRAGESLLATADGFGAAAREMGDAREEIKALEWPVEAAAAAASETAATTAVAEAVEINAQHTAGVEAAIREGFSIQAAIKDVLLIIAENTRGTWDAVASLDFSGAGVSTSGGQTSAGAVTTSGAVPIRDFLARAESDRSREARLSVGSMAYL